MSRFSAEERVGAALRTQLREPYVVYPNVAWLTKAPGNGPRDGEADFVVANPELGIMAIEVKGGGIRRADGQWESVDRTGTSHPIKDPFAQVMPQYSQARPMPTAESPRTPPPGPAIRRRAR